MSRMRKGVVVFGRDLDLRQLLYPLLTVSLWVGKGSFYFFVKKSTMMKSVAALLALSTVASAFTSQGPASTTSLKAAPGSIDFRGKEFVYDPVSFFNFKNFGKRNALQGNVSFLTQRFLLLYVHSLNSLRPMNP